jgi:DNA-binding transcriptional LysR family regulator
LEDEVGVKLLLRYPRGVRLTEAGAAFLIEAKDLLARSERAKRTARHTNSLHGGVVRIGYVPSAGHVVLPRFLDELRRIRPNAEIDVLEMITPQQVQALCAGEIDVGLARAPVNSARIVVAAELEDPFCLALPSRHALSGPGPIDLRAATDCTFVSSARHRAPAYFDPALALCSDAGFSPKLRYEASTLYGVLALVGAGLGVAIVPSSAVMLAPKGFTLRPLSRPTRGGVVGVRAIARRSQPVHRDARKTCHRGFRRAKKGRRPVVERRWRHGAVRDPASAGPPPRRGII